MAGARVLPSERMIEYEDLARTAQSYVADRPVVVLGTGATIPYGLPSMSELAEFLLATVDNTLPQWTEFSNHLRKTKDLEQSLHNVMLPDETVEAITRTTWELVSTKDAAFYRQLLKPSFDFAIADLFKFLLRTADAHIRVVTTNYDRLAEYAANYVGAYVSTGITAGWLQRFVPAAVNRERHPHPGYQGQVSLFKVHGSLDWFRDSTENVVGVPLAPTIPCGVKPLIVTPGVSKYREVQKDPFRTVMAAADDVLREASCYLCIGYGFNDEHVQPILVNRVKMDSVPLVLVTKKLSESVRQAFLSNPPKKFLFLEEADRGTMCYNPNHPAGAVCEDVSVWKLDQFMAMIFGNKAR